MSPDTIEDPNGESSDSLNVVDIREIMGERDAYRDVYTACVGWLANRGIPCLPLADLMHGQFDPRRNRFADTTEEYDYEYNY